MSERYFCPMCRDELDPNCAFHGKRVGEIDRMPAHKRFKAIVTDFLKIRDESVEKDEYDDQERGRARNIFWKSSALNALIS